MNYEQVLKSSLEYFNGDLLAASTWAKKYALQNNNEFFESTPDEMHIRLATEFARVEKKMNLSCNEALYFQRVYSLLKRFQKTVPQGSPMAGIGNPYILQSLSNCTVVDSPRDSIEGIFSTGLEIAQLQKRRAGVGSDLSTLRPYGSSVNNAAVISSGIPCFSDFYSYITRMIGQSARQGALMLTSSIKHPDAFIYATMKQDLKKVTGANVSLRVSDEFMQAVEADANFTQQWPVDVPLSEAKVVKVIKARDLWDVLVESAWKTAEPGLLMWDSYTRNLPAHCYPGFTLVSVNPCQPSYATVLTPEGIRTMGEIQIGSTIWSGSQWTKVTNKVCTGTKPVFYYRTSMGEFVGTENHRVLQNGERVEVRDAESIDRSVGPLVSVKSWDPGIVMDGLVLGDGTVHKASDNLVLLNLGEGDEEYLESEIKHLMLRRRDKIMTSGVYYEIETSIRPEELPRTFNREIPARYFRGDERTRASFLRGLFSANGSVIKGGRVRLKQASFAVIRDAQVMLSSLGIASYVVVNKPREIEFSNGTYTPKVSYDLNVHSDRYKFAELIGFIHERKNKAIHGNVGGKPKLSADIKSVEFIEEAPVFDITVEAEEHTYWTGGCLVSNCSELGLSRYDSCRLITQNLLGWVKDPFTKNAYFDLEEYFEDTKLAQRMSDGLVELELEVIDRILAVSDTESERVLWNKFKWAAFNGRRTGLGTHALGDLFLATGLRYDADDTREFARKVYKTHRDASYWSSVEMAKERGPFPVWNWETEKDNAFIKRFDPDLQAAIEKHGRRNISNLTLAPTGSVAIISRTSSGCETVFEWVHDRFLKVTHANVDFPIDRVDAMGDKWTKFRVVHPAVKAYFEANGVECPVEGGRDFSYSLSDANATLRKILPPHFVTSSQIDYLKGVELQGAIQEYIDHGISRTINLPKGSTKEQVEGIYLQAWKLGLKGVTVYVDGSRDGVLISSDDLKKVDKTETPAIDSSRPAIDSSRPEVIPESHAPKRPPLLEADVHHVKVKGEDWTVVVGLLQGKAYEVFCGKGLVLPKSGDIEFAHIKKVNSKRYSLSMKIKDNGVDEISDLREIYDNPEQRVITRSICRELRHGVPVEFMVRDLQDYEGSMVEYAAVLARVLKKYVKKTELLKNKCPVCGGADFKMVEGCSSCVDCGHSKCG